MDTQRKKGLLDICVLAILNKGPSYGYMIIREVSKCIEVSESTLYPILKRLEQSGSLVTYRQEYKGRTRKYYEVTDIGRNKIQEFLDEWEEMQSIYHFIEDAVKVSENHDKDAETVEEEMEQNGVQEKDFEPADTELKDLEFHQEIKEETVC